MSEIAVAVRDPGGNRFAQLLHDDLLVREIIVILADRLDLPTKVNYQLIEMNSGDALELNKSLQQAGIGGGAELEMRPIRDKAFDRFVKGLRKEIESELEGEAKDRAKDLLGKLLAGETVAEGSSAAGDAAAQGAAQASQAEQSATDGQAAQSSQAERSGETAAEPAKRGRSCLRIGCIGVVLVLAAAVTAGVLFYDDYVEPLISELMAEVNTQEPELGTGDVQVTLRWDNPVDLDLHVVDPSGEEVWFNNRTSSSGGSLDVDANGFCTGDAPVENIYWPTGGAPFGEYEVYVVYYQDCGYVGASAYTVTILVDGVTYGPYDGVFSAEPNEMHFITGFER